MGTVVTMPAPRRKRSTTAQTVDKATILLFMGVRYVRELDNAEHPEALTSASDRPDGGDIIPLVVA